MKSSQNINNNTRLSFVSLSFSYFFQHKLAQLFTTVISIRFDSDSLRKSKTLYITSIYSMGDQHQHVKSFGVVASLRFHQSIYIPKWYLTFNTFVLDSFFFLLLLFFFIHFYPHLEISCCVRVESENRAGQTNRTHEHAF